MKIKVMKFPMIPITLFLAAGIFFSGYSGWLPDPDFIVPVFIVCSGLLGWAHLNLRKQVHRRMSQRFYFVSLCFTSFVFGVLLSSLAFLKKSDLVDGYQ